MIKAAGDIHIGGKQVAGRPKLTWKKLTEKDCREWKLTTVDHQERSTWRLGERLEEGPRMWMMPLHLHVNKKSDYDDDDDELTSQWITKMIAAFSSTGLYSKGASLLFVDSFYRTPSKDDPEVNNRLHYSVFKLISKDTALPNIMLNGDFNTRDINWENLSVCPNPNYSTTLKNTMLDFVSVTFLTQMKDKPTRNENTLNLTLATNHDLMEDMDTHPGICDHCAVTGWLHLNTYGIT